MNPEPVEDCIHNTLSALYPPFDATAPTLFCQVFEVVARTYREDALRYTIEFLIPAKHILQRVQQDACSQYNGFLFCHEGWPLCLHEKVVVQLASLPWQHLRPGDFYLQVVPYLECSPRLVLKCLSTDSYSVQEVPVPEDSYSYIFTVEWLNGINKDRHTGRLENCLLAADDQVLRVPWSEVVYPQFVHKDEFIVGKRCSLDLMPPESLVAAHVPEILGARSPGDGRISNSDSKDCQAGQENQGKKPVRMGSITTLDPSDHPQLENIEGEYVELLEISLPLKDGGNNKEKYLGDQNIFKTKTVPTRKGHGKGRNKRHRAWLHQKMPKEDIQPGKNQVRRTWDGGKPVEEEEPHSASQIIQTEGTNQMENHPNSEEQVKGEGDYISPDIARSLVQARVDLGEAEGDHAKAGEKPKTSSTNLPSQMKYGLNDTSVAISMQSEHTPSDSIVEGRKSTLSPVACAGNPESEASDEQSSLLVDLIGQELILKYGYNQSSFPPIEGSTVEDTLTAQPSSSLSTNTQELQSMVAPTSAGAKGSPDRKEQEEHQDVLGDLLGANLELQTRTGPVPEGGSELAEGSPGLGGSGEQLMKGLEAEAAVVEDPDNENLKSKKTGKEPCDSQGTNLAERAIIGSERAEKNGGPLVNIAPKKHGKGKRRKKKGNWKGSARAEEQREKSRDATGLSRAEEAPEDLKTGTHTQGTGPDLEPVEEPEVTRLETACEADLLPQKEAPEVIGITESAEVQAEDNRLEEQEPLSEEAVGQQVVSSLPGDDASAGLPEEPEAVPAAPERDRAGSPQNASLPAPPSPTGLPPGQEVNWDILQSGIFCLTGGVDRAGRALVTVNPWALEAWRDASYSSRDLVGTLVHLSSLLRKEVRDLGLTLILDLRASPLPPPAAVLRALGEFQEMPPRSATSILILTDATDPDAAPLPEGLSTLQGAERTGLEELRRRVSLDQLPPGLGGSLAYSHSEWMQTQRTLDSLSQLCLEVLRSLLEVIEDMEAESSPEASEDIPSLIAQQQESMSKVLLDGRLSELQRSGGALIARLQKSPSHRNHTAAAFQLYEEVDEAIHRLVRLSNQRLRGLESHLELCRRQDQIREILAWVADEGERRLAEAGVLEAGDPVKALRRALEDFRSFRALAKEKLTQGLDALRQVESWEISPPRDRSGPCQRLEAFGQRLERKEDELQRSLHLYEFFQRAHEWALEGVRRLAAITEGSCSPRQRQEALVPLAQYQQQHPEIPERLFKEAKATALELQDQAALREWAQCWFKCQEIRKIVQKKTEAALGGAKAPPGPASRSPEGHRKRSDSVSLAPGKGEGRRFWGFGSVLSPSRSMTSLFMPPPPPPLGGPLDAASFQSLSPFGELAETAEEDVVFDGPAQRLDAPCGPHAPTLPVGEKVPWEPRKRGPASEGSASPFPRPRAFRGLLKKAQSMDSPAPPPADAVRPGWGQRALSEPGNGQGNVGVYIKGLEVSSTEVVDRTCSPKEHVMIGRGGSLMADAPWGGTPRMERKRRICNLQRLMTEAIGREREYVAWLSRALETHRKEPETWRDEAPQEPRLDWSALWWSLEKLQAFHAGYFLKELEGCLSHPLRVATCFLRYADQVSLYALYVKNRRKVEPVLSAHGAFFKSKQEEQEDGTGLGQHLQKPLEQLERYQRFLGEMTRECEPELVQECQSLRAAQELLGSQVHHGKNLFAVDSIRGFEVDLKEQGQLLLRDEFTIFSGRKRAQRQVFLFQHLLLFSKLKTTDGGQETYGYKQSFKTVDMGLTEEIGDSGLRFEVWFRRKKSREAYVFHASSPEVKHRWTSVIAQLLWTQASQNKDSQQTGSMAIGNKSFLDLRASFGAISERAINALLTGKGARTRASVAVSAFDHSGPFCERCPPSCCASVLGPLNLQLPGSPGSDRLASPGASSLPGRIEEEDSWDPVVSEVSLGGSDFGEPAENQRDCSQSSREPEGWARGCHNRSLSVPGNVSEKQSPIQDPATIPSPSTPV
ncbi:rho guanine nucleotide exchange factor 40-like [Rhinatrema bivittatum]|uniref:rho guanine nucleotide exchange factor 40-like n=1 Tax=Rhinatrema bivittatum TaxID=194408 RepID=UPI00112DAAA6|nr:rho guanine nucleotide exchange factor 40-like [Rhinatrema bivittatum]